MSYLRESLWQRRYVLRFQGGSLVSLIVPKVTEFRIPPGGTWARVNEVSPDPHHPFIDPLFSNKANTRVLRLSYEADLKTKLLIALFSSISLNKRSTAERIGVSRHPSLLEELK